jgi:SAM-dependent methyltransferase
VPDRTVKDVFCVLREVVLSSVLKRKYPEVRAAGFDVLAKEWSISQQRQRACCARRLGGLDGRTVLVLGCGFGDDALAWLPGRPGRILGVDVVNYRRCWEAATATRGAGGTEIRFLQHDLVARDWDFVEAGSVDVISSYAVLEHISDLPRLAERSLRALRPGGMFVATYGPLWYGPNGDHTFPRSEDDYYNHLLLDDGDYDQYILRTKAEWAHLEHACEGPFLLERGYFSFLKPGEYLDLFRAAGFQVVRSMINISSAAERYFVRHPDRYALLARRFGLGRADLYANGGVLVLAKPKR